MLEKPVELFVRKIMEDTDSAKLVFGNLCHGLHLRHITVNELHRNCALADRRGDPLDRTVSNVAHHEDTGNVALEQEGFAIQRPSFRTITVLAEIRSRQKEAQLIPLQSVLQPVR